jgi:hypothetical protein
MLDINKTITYNVISTGTDGAQRRLWSGEISWMFEMHSRVDSKGERCFAPTGMLFLASRAGDARHRVSTSVGINRYQNHFPPQSKNPENPRHPFNP